MLDIDKISDELLDTFVGIGCQGQYLDDSNWWIDVYQRSVSPTVDQIVPLLADASNEKLEEIRDGLNDRLAVYEAEKEEKILAEWILERYGDCITLRRKIDNEGTGYFYSHYTTVPVGYDTYEVFVDDEETCYCGQDCLKKSKKRKRD